MGKRKAVANIPYDLFLQTSWENSGKKGDYTEFVKTCGVKWQEMTDSEKGEYDRKDKDGIENVTSTSKRPRKAKKEKDANKPKRPRTSYILFCEANRGEVKESNPGLSMTGVIKELSARWNALDSAGKKQFIELAEKEKAKYKELLNQGKTQE